MEETVYSAEESSQQRFQELPKKSPRDLLQSFLTGSKGQPTTQASQARAPYPTPPGIEMSERFPGMVKPLPEELVYEWRSPSRPFKHRKKQFFTTLTTIVILLCLILFFAGQVLPVAVVLAVGFLAYVLATIPPQEIVQQFTTYGIRIEKELYYWEELGRFWFDKKLGSTLLIVEVARFPNRLTIVLKSADQAQEVEEILREVLLKQRPEKTWVEKSSDWLQKKFPLDIDA
jgi:hypothetical protein